MSSMIEKDGFRRSLSIESESIIYDDDGDFLEVNKKDEIDFPKISLSSIKVLINTRSTQVIRLQALSKTPASRKKALIA